MSIYLDEKNPGKHKPFQDASQDIVDYVRYLEVLRAKAPTPPSIITATCAISANS